MQTERDKRIDRYATLIGAMQSTLMHLNRMLASEADPRFREARAEIKKRLSEVDDVFPRMRWVNCEACGGSGEIVKRSHGARDPADEYTELCSACEGTGRDCAEQQN